MDKILVGVISMACLLISAWEVLGSGPGLSPCDGPTTDIKILVEYSEGSQTYKYTVINNSNSEIRYFIFGKGYERELRSNPENIPFDVRAPQGWRGRTVFGYENPYLSIFWNLTDKQMTIKHGETLSGFEVEMDAQNAKMTGLSFRVEVTTTDGSGKCYWGKVEVKQ